MSVNYARMLQTTVNHVLQRNRMETAQTALGNMSALVIMGTYWGRIMSVKVGLVNLRF